MSHYRDEHQRILTMIAEQHWQAFNREDGGLIRACVYSGFVIATSVPQHPGKTLLALTERGADYLIALQSVERPVFTSSEPQRRRVGDAGAEQELQDR
jgi:hypothetical protein